ncbi:MAG: T9SS type A sorting domain-containing protein [bacterium]|nr:T9SS type A sorting domain-containing protein [bacterium]
MKKYLTLFTLLLLATKAIASTPDVLWTKNYGGASDDRGQSVQQTEDGGFIIAGETCSFGAGGFDIYLIKTNSYGDTLWTRTFGGTEEDFGYSAQQTNDGGYIITGYTGSYGAGSYDLWLIKTDSSGNKTWDKTFGGTASDVGNSIQQTNDGGYIITGLHNGYYFWLVKTDVNGDSLWTTVFFGGMYDSEGNSVQQTTDSGYIITGYSWPYDTVGPGPRFNDVWLIKTDAKGDTLWTKTYDGINSYNDYGYSVQQTKDGGYIIVGGTGISFGGNDNMWLIKTDANGDTLWTRTYGGNYDDVGFSVQQTRDGGYIITGYYYNIDLYAWLVRTDNNGDTLWTKTVYEAQGNSVRQTKDGGYIITGTTSFCDAILIKTGLLKLIFPKGSETFTGGNNCGVIWQCDDTTFVNHYRLLYSIDGGNTYLDTIAHNVSSTDTSYIWTVPSINCTTCRIKLQALDSSNQVVTETCSDNDFSILKEGIETDTLSIPKIFFLINSPTSLFKQIIFIYNIPLPNKVSLRLYDLSGREVRMLVDGEKPAGSYSVTLNANKLKAGVYFVRLTTGEQKIVKKLVLMK